MTVRSTLRWKSKSVALASIFVEPSTPYTRVVPPGLTAASRLPVILPPTASKAPKAIAPEVILSTFAAMSTSSVVTMTASPLHTGPASSHATAVRLLYESKVALISPSLLPFCSSTIMSSHCIRADMKQMHAATTRISLLPFFPSYSFHR